MCDESRIYGHQGTGPLSYGDFQWNIRQGRYGEAGFDRISPRNERDGGKHLLSIHEKSLIVSA